MKKIKLTQGFFAIVDDEDFEYLNQWKWSLLTSPKSKTVYAIKRFGTSGHISMHNLILGEIGVDHKNCNGLDNRRSNLRKATFSQQRMNTIKRKSTTVEFKGVSFYANRFVSRITVNGKVLRLGRFKNKIDAAMAYDQAALKYFGEFANTNFK